MDPLAAAPNAAKAVKVNPGKFRALDEQARLLRPLIGRGCHVWKSPERIVRDGNACHDWRLGVRLGPNESGVYSQRIFDLDATPPGIRKAGFREVIGVLRSPGQVGRPPGVATDAESGFSVMAYQ